MANLNILDDVAVGKLLLGFLKYMQYKDMVNDVRRYDDQKTTLSTEVFT